MRICPSSGAGKTKPIKPNFAATPEPAPRPFDYAHGGPCRRGLDLPKESRRLATAGREEYGKPTVGFEPTTTGLQNQSSTIELRWHHRFEKLCPNRPFRLAYFTSNGAGMQEYWGQTVILWLMDRRRLTGLCYSGTLRDSYSRPRWRLRCRRQNRRRPIRFAFPSHPACRPGRSLRAV